MKPDQERVRTIIHNTIISLCENGLKFDKHLRIEGVIGVTTDEQEIFIIHINESVNAESCTGRPFPGGRPSGVAPRRAAPKSVPRRAVGEGAFVRGRPPFQSSPNSSMGLRGFAQGSPQMNFGSPRMNFGSPRMLAGMQRSPMPVQRMPVKSPGNSLQGMPRLQRFSPKASLNSPSSRNCVKPGLLSLPAPLAKEVLDDSDQALPPKRLFPPSPFRNPSSQFPQICDVPCKSEKMDVILVDDDDHADSHGTFEQTEIGKVECRSSPGRSLPDLEPEIFPGVPVPPAALEETGTGKDIAADAPLQNEPTVDDENISASVPGCSGIPPDTLDRVDQDEKSSTRASVDNSSLTSFEMGFSLDRPFNPEDYASEDYETEDMSFTDPDDEDWKSDGDTMSDPDWSEKSPKKKKARVTPRKTGTPGGSVFNPKQVSHTPNQSRSKLTQKFGKFSQVPQTLLNSACGEEDSWKLVARFVCNISGCNASFSQKYNLIRHQKAKHGRATKRSNTMMADLDQGDSYG